MATTLRGSPRDWAISSEVTLLNPNWNWPLTTPGTIAAPPWPVSMVRSMPRLEKNPFSLPRWMGATSRIGMTPTLT